jgi:large subunit ribosomal protein L21
MFAVIKTGGKQYRVAQDDVIRVEKLAAETGDIIELGNVLMVGGAGELSVGAPYVTGATVAAEVLEQGRGKKIIIFKKKRRQNYRRRNGHRQHETVLRVTEILTDGKKPSKTKAAPKAAPKVAAKPKAPAKTDTAQKAPADTAPKKAAPKKEAAKKAAPKKTAAKKTTAKKPAAKKAGAAKAAKKKD